MIFTFEQYNQPLGVRRKILLCHIVITVINDKHIYFKSNNYETIFNHYNNHIRVYGEFL